MTTFTREQFEKAGREWSKMAKLPESGEPWKLSETQWDVITAALKIAAEQTGDVAAKEGV